jgi:uncharacterized protein
MTDLERKDLASSFIVALRARNLGTFQRIFTDDVVWSIPGNCLVSGIAEGAEGILKRAGYFGEYGISLDIEHVVLGYEGVALLLHNTGNRNGRILDEHLTTVCTLREGKIARLDTYISDIPMLDAYFA